MNLETTHGRTSHWAEGTGSKEFGEQLTWFAREVMPAFRPGR